MLRIIQNSSAAGAKGYYTTADYYSEGQEIVGVWCGKGAAMLGLSGNVNKNDWDALCDNRNPATGRTLTVRQRQFRRIGYDINFHAPKSVSLLYALTNDERLLTAFRDSVDETMRDMESEMKTRVRRNGLNEDRITGNMVWGTFVHGTSRPVDGVPDCHLHAHCFTFSATHDPVEDRWKAGQFADLKRDAPYFEALFHSRLADRLAKSGLPIERTQMGWEIAGIPRSAIDKFSRRTAIIEAKAKSKGVTDAKEKAELGAKTRERKATNLSLEELRKLWADRLSDAESRAVANAHQQLGTCRIAEDREAASVATDRAIEHCFERKSVVPERELLAAAIKGAVGKASAATVELDFRNRKLLTAEKGGRQMVTTAAVLAEERQMVDFARRGRGACAPLGRGVHKFQREWLNAGQRKAVENVLTSRDRVVVIRGGAGVGKTSMMGEAVEGIQGNGVKVFTFAPSADASRGVLRNEGFENAETVARLLHDRKIQEAARGQVLWIDEAGLLSARSMAQLFDLADRLDARVILSGDKAQHGSVDRGAALRLLETEAGIIPSEIKEILRQKENYRKAVQALSEGRTADGFRQLDQMNWIREVADDDRYKLLASDYVATIAEGKSALVVSPTHLEGERITEEIRKELCRTGQLGKDQTEISVLEQTNMTVAERRDAVSYMPGDVIVFHQNAKGFRKGQRIVVGNTALPLANAEKFQVFRRAVLPVAAGDSIRIRRNGKTADKRNELRNGAIYKVKTVREKDIELINGWRIAKDFGFISHGYVVTSHSSQGRTTDRVFVGQSSGSFPASSREQFYVSLSRAKERATIYTDDKSALLDAVNQSDDRLSAIELISERARNARQTSLARNSAQFDALLRQPEKRMREGVIHE